MKKVLLAVDETDGSQSVLSVLKAMAPGPESVVLLHVIGTRVENRIERPGERGPGSPEKILDFYRKEVENDGFVRVKTMVRQGIPSDEILGVAQKEEADIIIMGSNRNSLLQRLSAGSVVKKVEQNASVPVLVAKKVGRKKSITCDWRGEVYAA